MKRRWEITRLAETARSTYYGVGKEITVVKAPSTAGPRYTCLTCRTTDSCEHTQAVQSHLTLTAAAA